MSPLKPCLIAASRAITAELPPGERIGEVMSDEATGTVWVSTDSAHEHGIAIYGMSDEEG